jgi:hypothetical protein
LEGNFTYLNSIAKTMEDFKGCRAIRKEALGGI